MLPALHQDLDRGVDTLLPHLAPAPRPGPADLRRRAPARPRQPGRRSPSAAAKTGPGNQALRSFRGLLDHLATLTRDTIRIAGQPVDKLTTPTPDQRRAFDLIGAPIPLTLT